MEPSPVVIWCLTDNKPGHRNQLRGLANALQRRLPCDVHWLAAPGPTYSAACWILRRFPPAQGLPAPSLILAAGHGTHWPALAARRARGGKIILLMRPTLPCEWFDLCIVPDHDTPPASDIVVTTRGVINCIQPGSPQSGTGLILIGGPSRRHGWSNATTASQVRRIVEREPHRRWRLTTSRRTPASFLSQLQAPPNLEVVPVEKTDADWVPRELARAEQVWVTEDSASMVYEALTAGGAVGVLPVPRRGSSRVARGLDQLRQQGWITCFADWERGQALRPPPHRLAEADRCAAIVEERFLRPHAPS